MRLLTRILAFSILLFTACQSDDQSGPSDLDNALTAAILASPNINEIENLILPESNEFNKIPQDPNNRITAKKVELGKFLFHETGLAQNPKNEIGRGTYSCASCHNAAGGFQSGRFQAIGDGGIGFGPFMDRTRHMLYKEDDLDVQPIRTPSSLNIAYQTNVLWNGQFGATDLNEGTESQWTEDTPKEKNKLGYEGTETQAIAGLEVHRLVIEKELIESLGYLELFDEVFPEFPERARYTIETAGLAIAAYERTQLANESPFQEWLRGDYMALNAQQKRGAINFFDKGECATCHGGPSLANMEFHAIGMGDLFTCPEEVFKTDANVPEILGRASFTGNAEDNYRFKVPTLYNLKDSPFYGHGSTFTNVRDVIDYKNNAIKQSTIVPDDALSEHFKPLNLTQSEIEDLEAFIVNALYDSNLERYVPESLPSGNCFPNADPLSKQVLGCN